MNIKIYNLVSRAKQAVCALALTVLSGTVYSQQSYTLNYTGGMQNLNLQAGTYSIECWGAIGGWHANDLSMLRGKGGYSCGTITLTAATNLFIAVGGAGGAQVNGTVPGGWNGGGPGKYYTYAFNAGGGASHVATATGTLAALVSNTPAVLIVAGGGGGGSSGQTPGNGGGAVGGNGTRSGCTGGTQTTPGASSIGGGNATFGQGWDANLSGGSYGGGGGGWYGGGCESGGSGYIGGVSNGITTGFGQPGFVANPDVSGNGLVIIRELCSITMSVIGTNASGAMCSGNSVTLTTNAISNYTWSNGAITSSIVVSPAATTQYSLTATSPSNCTASSLITVTVSGSVPTLTVANTANSGGICPTKTVMLTATGAITYTWTGGTVPVTNGVPFAPTTAADYTVTGANGCGDVTAVTSVSVHPFPTVNPAASSSTLCAGSSLTLTATGNATNYVWSGGNAPGGNGVGFFPPASTVTYSVIGTSALSCTAQATIPVTTHATPQQPALASPALICIGGSSTLTAAGATSYTWASATQTVYTTSYVVTPSAPGVTTYTVTKSNSTCADTKVVSVTTNSLPSIFAMANPNVVCALQPSSLSIGGGVSYTWTSPGTPNFTFTGASPVVYPASSTNYSVAASDGTCISLTTVSVTTNPNPTITTGATSPSICIGQQVTITAYGGNSYTWTTGTNTFYTNPITDSPTTAVAYDVTGDNNFGCTASVQQIVLVYPLPPTNAIAGKQLACSGGSVLLTASGANSYTWDANAGGAVSPTVVVYPANSTSGPVIYTVTGSYATTGCAFSKTVSVGVYVPTLSVSGTTIACVGGQISVNATGGNPNTYTWSTGSTTSNFPSLTAALSAPAVFTVSAMSTSLIATCLATRTVALANYSVPVITATAERTLICPKEATQLFANGGVSYMWSNSQSGGTITIAPVAQTNNYTVTGTDANGCAGTGSVQVKLQNCTGIEEQAAASALIVVYPNPNNGAFSIKGNSEMHLQLVNQLGQVVANVELSATTNYEASIKGPSKGVYFISAQDQSTGLYQKVIVTD